MLYIRRRRERRGVMRGVMRGLLDAIYRVLLNAST